MKHKILDFTSKNADSRRSCGDRRAVECVTWGMIGYFLALAAGPEAHASPVMPLPALYAAYGLNDLLGFMRARQCAPP